MAYRWLLMVFVLLPVMVVSAQAEEDAQAILDALNEERIEQEKEPLVRDETLDEAAFRLRAWYYDDCTFTNSNDRDILSEVGYSGEFVVLRDCGFNRTPQRIIESIREQRSSSTDEQLTLSDLYSAVGISITYNTMPDGREQQRTTLVLGTDVVAPFREATVATPQPTSTPLIAPEATPTEIVEAAPLEENTAVLSTNGELVETAPISEFFELVLSYNSSDTLTMSFGGDVPQVWLYGLEFHWQSVEDNTIVERTVTLDELFTLEDRPYAFPADGCVLLSTSDVAQPAEGVTCSQVVTLNLEPERIFWLPTTGEFTLWQEGQMVSPCVTDITPALCRVDVPHNIRDNAPAAMILDWSGGTQIFIRFNTISPRINLNEIGFMTQFGDDASRRYYMLSDFSELGSAEFDLLNNFDPRDCLLLGAQPGISLPDGHCTGRVLIDDQYLVQFQETFWGGLSGTTFDVVRVTNTGDVRLGTCVIEAQTCDVLLD